MKGVSALITIVAIFSSINSFAANETSCNAGGACPGQGGQGGNGGSGGTSTAVSTASSVSSAISGSISGALSNSSANPISVANGGEASGGVATASGNGGSATNGPVSNSVTTGNVRSLSLGAAAVGSPSQGTCGAYVAIAFGLLTVPTTLESCVAMQEAMMLEHLGLKDAAIARMCQLDSIQETGICQPRQKQASLQN